MNVNIMNDTFKSQNVFASIHISGFHFMHYSIQVKACVFLLLFNFISFNKISEEGEGILVCGILVLHQSQSNVNVWHLVLTSAPVTYQHSYSSIKKSVLKVL